MSKFNEPREETFSEWYNPLDVEQHVDIREGDAAHPTRYRIPAGGTKMIPSRHDRVVQVVHNGVIIGGQAPQLVKRGSNAVLDDALNTELSKKKKAEQDLAVANLAKLAAEDAGISAAAARAEADKNLAKQAAPLLVDAPALPPDAKKRG